MRRWGNEASRGRASASLPSAPPRLGGGVGRRRGRGSGRGVVRERNGTGNASEEEAEAEAGAGLWPLNTGWEGEGKAAADAALRPVLLELRLAGAGVGGARQRGAKRQAGSGHSRGPERPPAGAATPGRGPASPPAAPRCRGAPGRRAARRPALPRRRLPGTAQRPVAETTHDREVVAISRIAIPGSPAGRRSARGSALHPGIQR